MNPILYEEGTTDFNDNGLGSLSESLSSYVTEVANGEFELEVVYPTTGYLYKELKEFRLLSVKPNKKDEVHAFEIYDYELDSAAKTVTLYARTITNKLAGNLVKKVVVKNNTPQEAMALMKNNLVVPTNFAFVSDITARSSTEWTNRNPLNCIAGEDGSLLHYWGGEIKRDNRTIYLYKRRGTDNAVVLREGRDLEGMTIRYSTEGMVTRVVPYRTYTPEGDDKEEITEYGSIVDSQYVNNYPNVFIRAIDYSSDDDVDSLATMNAKAKKFFSDNSGIDKPSMTANVDLIELSESPEYKDFKDFETIGLFDAATVYSKRFGVNLTSKVNKVVYDTIREKNISVELGSYKTGLIESVEKEYQQLNQAKEEKLINIIQMAANGKNRIFRGDTEPTKGMAKNDLWYQPVGAGETMLYRFDGAHWQLEKVSAGLLGGSLDALNGDVDIINLNANNVASGTFYGLRYINTFLRGKTPGVLTIDGDIKMQAGDEKFSVDVEQVLFDNGTEKTTLSHGGLNFYRKGELIGEIKIEYFTTTDETAVTITNAKKGTNGIRINQNRIEVTERNQGANDLDIFVIPSGEGKILVSDPTKFSWKGVRALDYEFPKRSRIYETPEGNLEVQANATYTLRQGGGTYAFNVDASRMKLQRDLDMSGNKVTNTSDIRLKKNVEDAEIDPLKQVNKMKFITAEWDKTNPFNHDKPDERFFGQVAQYAPTIMQVKNGIKDHYLSIDKGVQSDLNSMAIQELDKKTQRIETLEQELADLKALLTDKGVI